MYKMPKYMPSLIRLESLLSNGFIHSLDLGPRPIPFLPLTIKNAVHMGREYAAHEKLAKGTIPEPEYATLPAPAHVLLRVCAGLLAYPRDPRVLPDPIPKLQLATCCIE